MAETTKRIPRTAPQRILVVDDNADAAAVIRAMLELDGHQVAVATDGAAALQSAREFRPSVVLLDIGMPVMDGYAVAGHLRADPLTAQAVLVAMTGYGRDEDLRRARTAGFDHHLLKPVALQTLQSLLATLPPGADVV